MDRTKSGQDIHDRVVKALGTLWRNSLDDATYQIHTNPGQQKNQSANSDNYPDIVVTRRGTGTVACIDEVETSESVTESEAKDQWVRYGKLGISFDLTVERGSEGAADRLIQKHKVKVRSLWKWYDKNGITFSKVKDY